MLLRKTSSKNDKIWIAEISHKDYVLMVASLRA